MACSSSSVGTYNVLPSSTSLETVAGEANGMSTEEDVTTSGGKLSTFFGVIVPVILSMFSVILFLRLGQIVGQTGFVFSVVMFVIAYVVVGLTVLSISAIATNGTVRGGGAYFMISRTLGPEFGGSIGIIFYFANVFASALYVLGFVEALVSNVGHTGSLVHTQVFHDGRWWHFLYGSLVLLLCLIVCLIGAGMFAKTSFVIFLAVMVSVSSSFVSFFRQDEITGLKPPSANKLHRHDNFTFNYTGWSVDTFYSNLWQNYTKDYTTNEMQDFQVIFGLLFNGVTGIMAGANMSGDLKNPGYAIPFGTLAASLFTFVVYLLLVLFTSFTCSRDLLQNDYNYIQVINLVKPLITVGVFAATLSASLSCLIGASRILQAVAKDKLLTILKPFARTSGWNNEPLRAVLISWLFVQLILFTGKLSVVAPVVSMFFLLSYGVTNLACFALKVASAPNFRPTFQYFSWQLALLGTLCCFVIMFVVNALYATIAIALMIILFMVISIRAPATPWGDVAQAVMYHQVRKYLLRLDVRKDHVKFWRPQVLLLIANPRSSYPLIDFVNDIKKSGLYILGHVQSANFDGEEVEKYSRDVRTLLNFVECAEIKAFVQQTIAPTIRIGTQNLLMTSGLGGMRPNTLILGFFDHNLPVDRLSRGVNRKSWRFLKKNQKNELYQNVLDELPRLRTAPSDQRMDMLEYVGVIKDAILLRKNVCIARNFGQLQKSNLAKNGYIDVWPVNATSVPEGLGPYDFTYLLILQLSCVLHMVPFWENRTKLRVFTVVNGNEYTEHEDLTRLLRELRIPAEVKMIHADSNSPMQTRNADGLGPSTNWYRTMNHMIRLYSSEAYVVFTGLPHPPSEESMSAQFMQDLTLLSDNLPPVMMIYGRSPVVSTAL